MRYRFRIDGRPIPPAQRMMRSTIYNITSAIFQHKETITDPMQSLLSYVQAFEERYGVLFVDVRITDIIKDIMSSNSLACNFR